MKAPAIAVYTFPTAAQTASGNSGSLGVASLDLLAIDLNVSAISGSGASIQFFLEREGMDGGWYVIWQSASITATGTTSASVGPGMSGTGNAAAMIGRNCRLRWTIAGTTPSVTVTGGIIGR